jgi:hypothetical protein
MKWVWIATFVVVALFGAAMTPWDVLRDLLANQGVSDEGGQLMAFVAGYTLPLTVGFGVCALLYLRGAHESADWRTVAVVAAGILFLAGAGAAELGLGLLPVYDNGLPSAGGHPALRFVLWVLTGYFNSYGWPLMVCALALGCAAAAQVHVWIWPPEPTES